MSEEPDVMDALAGLDPGSPTAELRRERPDVLSHMQGSDRALFSPRDEAGLSRAERAAAALRIALLLRHDRLAEHYQAHLAPLDPGGTLAKSAQAGPDGTDDRRWRAVLAHTDKVSLDPASATKADIDALLAAGLSPRAVVALSELIAYVHFQSRVLAGLTLLRSAS